MGKQRELEAGLPTQSPRSLPSRRRAGRRGSTISNTDRQIAAEEAQQITWLSSVAQVLGKPMPPLNVHKKLEKQREQSA